MVSLGLGFGIAAGLAIMAPSRNRRMYLAGNDLAYILMPTSWGTAVAIRLQRNVGGAGATDAASPWAVWRRTGAFEVAAMNSDPAVPLFIYGSDSGAFDYAFQESSTNLFGGSYHGGETVVAEQWYADGAPFDPAAGERLAAAFALVRTSVVTYAAGKTLSVGYEIAVNRDGTITEKATFSSTAAFTNARFLGMDILSRSFDEVRLAGGVLDVETIGNYDLAASDAGDITYRSLSTGHTVRIASNTPLAVGYAKTYVASQSGRIKHYPQFASTAGAALGTVAYERTITLQKGLANRFSYSAKRDGLTGASRASEAAPTIDTATDPDTLVFDRSRTATTWIDRHWQIGPLEAGNWRVNLNYVKTGTGSVGTSLIVTTATNGSIVSPVPIAQTGFSGVSDHYDFVIENGALDPVTLHLRMGTSAGSTERLAITSFNLERR